MKTNHPVEEVEAVHPLTREEFAEVARDSDNYDIFSERLVVTVTAREAQIDRLRASLRALLASFNEYAPAGSYRSVNEAHRVLSER